MTVKRKGSVWVARVDLGKVNGKRKQKYKQFTTKHEAESWERAMKARRGIYTGMTVSEFWDTLYLPHISERVREVTLDRYVRNFDTLCRHTLGDFVLEDVRPIDVQRLIDEAPNYSQQRNLYATMRQLLRTAHKWGMLQSVATDGCTLPEHRRKAIEVISAADVPSYLGAVREYEPQILAGVCVSMMGARRSEVCALDWSDVDLGEPVQVAITKSLSVVDGRRCVSGTKTERSSRVIVLPGYLGEIMRSEASTGAVVPVQPDAYSKAWRRAVRKAGLPDVSLKNLRHSVGTMLVDSGLPITTVQDLLGHDLPTTTSRYYLQRTGVSFVQAAEQMQSLLDEPLHTITQD